MYTEQKPATADEQLSIKKVKICKNTQTQTTATTTALNVSPILMCTKYVHFADK